MEIFPLTTTRQPRAQVQLNSMDAFTATFAFGDFPLEPTAAAAAAASASALWCLIFHTSFNKEQSQSSSLLAAS